MSCPLLAAACGAHFLLDANGFMAVVNGDFALVSGQAAVKQGIGTRLRMYLGESFLDETIGVDWLGQVLIKGQDPIVINEILRAPILATPDVTAVIDNNLTEDAQTRELTTGYTVYSTYSKNPLPAL